MFMLVLAMVYGAGPYGMAGVPFLFGLFLATAVVAGRATGSIVGRLSSVGAWVVGDPVAVAAFIGSAAVWNGTPSESPLLVRIFGITAAVSVTWALASRGAARKAARFTAIGACTLWIIVVAAHL
jgi:hypothetical protein